MNLQYNACYIVGTETNHKEQNKEAGCLEYLFITWVYHEPVGTGAFDLDLTSQWLVVANWNKIGLPGSSWWWHGISIIEGQPEPNSALFNAVCSSGNNSSCCNRRNHTIMAML